MGLRIRRPSENRFSDGLFPSPTDTESVSRSGGGKGSFGIWRGI